MENIEYLNNILSTDKKEEDRYYYQFEMGRFLLEIF